MLLESTLEWPQASQGVSELSRRVGLSKNRTFRILQTLEARGYFRKDPETQAYQVGVTLMRLAHHVPRHFEFFSFVSPHLESLAQESQEIAHLLVRRGHHAVCVGHRESGRRLRVSDRVGEMLPLHVGASPKLFLAFAQDSESEELLKSIHLEQFTSRTLTKVSDLRKRLRKIRECGHSVEEEEYEDGVCAVGAPVFNEKGALVAGISLTVPKSRFSPNERERLISLATSAAWKISGELGHRPVAEHKRGARETSGAA